MQKAVGIIAAQGYGSTDKVSKSGDTVTGPIVLTGSPPIQIPSGAANGDVLTSDASGNCRWGPPGSGGGTPSGAAGGDLGSTYPNPTVTGTHLSSPLPIAQGGTASGSRVWAGLLTPTAVKTSAYTAAAGDFVPVSTASGSVSVTLPTTPPDLTVVGVKHVVQGASNAVTVACPGAAVFNVTGGATSMTLPLLSQGILLQYSAASSVWYVLDDDIPLAALDTRYGGGGGAAATSVSVTASPYSADPTGTADSTSAFGSWVTALTTSNMPGYIPPGTYKISGSALDWRVNGLVIKGAGAGAVTIRQTTGTVPIVMVAGTGQDISGFTLAYSSQPAAATTGAIGLAVGDDTVGSCFMSNFHEISFLAVNTAIATNPAVAVKSGVFSCTFANISVSQYSLSAINLVGSNGLGANNTGCVFSNIYTANTNGTNLNATGPAFSLTGWDEVVINQLNVEHGNVTAGHLIQLVRVGNAVFNSLHVEGVTQSGNGFATIYSSGGGTVVVNGMSVRFGTFSGSASNPVVKFFGTSTTATGYVRITGWNESGNTITTPSHPYVDFNSAVSCTAVINGLFKTQTTAASVNPGTGCTATIGP